MTKKIVLGLLLFVMLFQLHQRRGNVFGETDIPCDGFQLTLVGEGNGLAYCELVNQAQAIVKNSPLYDPDDTPYIELHATRHSYHQVGSEDSVGVIDLNGYIAVLLDEPELVVEVLAHELIHRQQVREYGAGVFRKQELSWLVEGYAEHVSADHTARLCKTRFASKRNGLESLRDLLNHDDYFLAWAQVSYLLSQGVTTDELHRSVRNEPSMAETRSWVERYIQQHC